TAPNLATPQPSLRGHGASGAHGAPGAHGAHGAPGSNSRIPAPPPGRIPGPPTGAPKTLFGMPAPNLSLPQPQGQAPRAVPAPAGAPPRTMRTSMPSFPAVPSGTQSFDISGPASTPTKPKGKGLTIALLLLLVVGGAGAGGYYWFQNRPGKVEIATVPAEATILVDNVKVAEKSPFTLEKPPGPYTVSVVRPGYTRNDQSVVVHAGQSANLAVSLEPSADTGFELTSVPPGGLVWLDGNPIGGPDGQARTDFRAYKIPPGKHLFEIKGDPKLQPWSQEVVIEPGVITKIKATLSTVGEPPKVATPPSGGLAAEQPKGEGAAKPGGLALGATPAHRRPARPARERSDDDSSSSSRLGGDDDSGGGDCTITVGTRPWSEVWIDGKNTGRHTPYSESIPCGRHKLVFKRPDMNLLRNESVNIKPGEKFRQSYPLEEE
ncbi:MAG TPA: PEGA domain-containing protein, partial [Polyangia bacterium]